MGIGDRLVVIVGESLFVGEGIGESRVVFCCFLGFLWGGGGLCSVWRGFMV